MSNETNKMSCLDNKMNKNMKPESFKCIHLSRSGIRENFHVAVSMRCIQISIFYFDHRIDYVHLSRPTENSCRD